MYKKLNDKLLKPSATWADLPSKDVWHSSFPLPAAGEIVIRTYLQLRRHEEWEGRCT